MFDFFTSYIDKIELLHPNLLGRSWAVFILLAAVPFAWLLKRILHILKNIIFSKTETDLDDKIVSVIEKRIFGLTIILALRLSMREFRETIPAQSIKVLEAATFISEVLYVIQMLILARVAAQIVGTLIEYYFQSLSDKRDAQELTTIAPLVRKTSTLIVFVIGAIIVLDHFSINIGSLIVSLGVGSLAIALAAQDTLANIIAGFIIAIDKPFRIGDRIQLTSGKIGDIFLIGLRSTKIKDFDNNLLIIPNAELVKSVIINYAYPDQPTRVLVPFSVAYGTDIERVRKLILALVEKRTDVYDTMPAEVQFMEFQASGVQLRLEMHVQLYKQKFNAEIELREAIHKTLIAEGISFPFPQQVVHFATPITTKNFSDTVLKPESNGGIKFKE